MRQSMVKKAIWYALLCGLSAMMPEVISAINASPALSQVPWMKIFDEKGVMFVTAALSGLGIGSAKAGWANRDKPGQITPVSLLILCALPLLVGCARGANFAMPKLPGPADVVTCETHRENSDEGTYKCTIEGRYVMEGVGIF